MYVYIYIYISTLIQTINFWALGQLSRPAEVWQVRPEASPKEAVRRSEKGKVLLRGIGTPRFFFVLSENSACQVPICAVAA